MKLNFLFLPFVGMRDYRTYTFHVNGHRFKSSRTAECQSCVYYKKIKVDKYSPIGYGRYVHNIDYKHDCNKYHNATEDSYTKHPCKDYAPRNKLKRI